MAPEARTARRRRSITHVELDGTRPPDGHARNASEPSVRVAALGRPSFHDGIGGSVVGSISSIKRRRSIEIGPVAGFALLRIGCVEGVGGGVRGASLAGVVGSVVGSLASHVEGDVASYLGTRVARRRIVRTQVERISTAGESPCRGDGDEDCDAPARGASNPLARQRASIARKTHGVTHSRHDVTAVAIARHRIDPSGARRGISPQGDGQAPRKRIARRRAAELNGKRHGLVYASTPASLAARLAESFVTNVSTRREEATMRIACPVLTAISVLALGCSNNGNSSPPPGTGGDASTTQDAAQSSPDAASQPDTGGPVPDAADAGDPSVLFVETAGIGDMQIDATSLYWIAGGTRIMRMPLAGGMPVALVSAPQMAGASIVNIAVDASNLYWDEAQPTFGSAGGVFAGPLADAGAVTKLASVHSPGSLSLDGDALYVNTMPTGDNTNGEIDRVPTSGGATTALVRGVNAQSVIVAVDGFVYLVVDQANYLQNVFRVADDASAGPADAAVEGGEAGVDAGPLQPVSANGRVSTLVLARHPDGHEVYWAVFDEVHSYPGDAGMQVDLGTVSDPLNPQSGGSIDALYPSNGDVFWYSQGFGGPTGDLWKFAAGGDPRNHLAYTKGGPFVADGTFVYFADGMRIRRIAR